jgi:formylglycine-generating enzyme required for sulfatase activity
MTRKLIRIFLASPKDTEEARHKIVDVVDEINADPAYRDRLAVELVRWDDPAKPVPCSFLRNPQNDVVTYAGDPGSCDLVVGLLRHRFGSPLPEKDWGLSPDGDPWTGTEWEVERGIAAAEAGSVKDVWVFRDLTEFKLGPRLSQAERRERFDAYDRVQVYLESCCGAGRSILRGINEYNGPNRLPKLFGKRLREWLAKYHLDAAPEKTAAPSATAFADPLTPDQQRLLDILLKSDKPPKDGLVDKVRTAPVRGVRSYLLSRYAYWATRAQGHLDRQFINLDLLVDHGPGSGAEGFSVDVRYDSLTALLTAHGDVGAWLLVGDPGCGKSTVLQHFELTQARAALRAIASGAERPPLCVWQRLADYSAGSPAPREWLDAQWVAHYPQLPPLSELAQRFDLRFLLDGLNELKAEAGEPYRAAVRAFADWAASGAAQSRAAPLFSVRTLENSQSLSSEALTVREIRMARWTSDQMRHYCALRLGPDNALWPAIEKDRAIHDLCELPFNLSAQCEVHAALERPAQGRAELLSALTWQRLRRGIIKCELDGEGLLTSRDRKQLNDPRYWRDNVLDLPEEGSLVSGLDRQAEAMHRAGRGVEVSVQEKDVGLWLTHPPQREAWLAAVQAVGLAETELSGRFRFAHQVLQEFFAARSLRAGVAELPDGISPPELEPMADVLAGLTVQDPLPGPGVSPWEEVIKLAVQLSKEPETWIGRLADVNLPLAGRAACAVRDRLSASCLDDLRWRLVRRSRDAAVDLRQRIEAAEALGPLGDPRYRSGCGPGGVRYLVPDDAHWFRIPGGRYSLGSDDGDSGKQPIIAVDLQPFSMAWAPVTNAEFACFIEAGGYEDERWWVGDIAMQWWRGELANEGHMTWWRERFAALRKDFDAAVNRFFPNATKAQKEDLRTYAAWTEQEAEDALQRGYGAKRHRSPGEWTNVRFNLPGQPIVGISVFEADAYCRWLSAQCGRPMRLPVEAEWEGAARGQPAHRWPWGSTDPTPAQMNADPAHLRRTSPVGVFPGSDSILLPGLADLAGNVWEWTASTYRDHLDPELVKNAAGDVVFPRAVRGGSWSYGAGYCRAVYRGRLHPVNRNDYLGFRMVCCPIQEP